LSGVVDAFLTRLDPNLPPKEQHLFSTYLGGPTEDRPQGFAMDSSGHAYLVGPTDSVQMQGVDGQSSGGYDGFIAVLDLRLPVAGFTVDGPRDGAVTVDASASTTPAGTSIESYRWDFGDGSTAEGKVASHSYPLGRFTIALIVTNDLGLTSTKSQVVTIPCTAGDVAPWTAADIGAPGFPGSARREGNCFSLCAGGSLLVGKADKLHFIEKESTGDYSLTLRIEEMEGVAQGAQLGLMARESLDADSVMAAVGIYRSTAAASFRFNSRSDTGGSISTKIGEKTALPAWVRFERKGTELIGSGSSDGVTWTEVGRLALGVTPVKLLVGIFGLGKEPADPASVFEPLRGRACLESTPVFRRGDANADGKVDISDAIAILGYLFGGGDGPACLDAADANDDGKVDISDAIYLLAHLFLGGPAPPAPGPIACGGDPTDDNLPECAYDPARC
jgi:PKD repeat protein